MLDVHPPHQVAHTWKDFFIHIATICVGLLIAIGLEQAVEAIHHHHQRHQLEADLHSEGLRDIHIALDNLRLSERRRVLDAQQYTEILLAAQQHRTPAHISLFNHPEVLQYVKPAYAVWTVAQQSGTLNLLPRTDAQRYVRVYSLVQMVNDQLMATNDSIVRRTVAGLPGVPHPSTPQAFLNSVNHDQVDLSLLDPGEQSQFRTTVGEDMASCDQSITMNVLLYGIEWAVLHGSTSDEENVRILYDAASLYAQGGEKALLARYPLPAEPSYPTAPDSAPTN